MKIRVCSSKEDIVKLIPNETRIHLAFRPSSTDIFSLVETCPKLEYLQMPGSYRKVLSKSIEKFLEMQRIKIEVGDVWGNRSDLNVYYDQVSA